MSKNIKSVVRQLNYLVPGTFTGSLLSFIVCIFTHVLFFTVNMSVYVLSVLCLLFISLTSPLSPRPVDKPAIASNVSPRVVTAERYNKRLANRPKVT